MARSEETRACLPGWLAALRIRSCSSWSEGQALLDDLGDVEYKWQVECVFFLALGLVQLADGTDDQVGVGLPESLQQSCVIGVVVEVGREYD